MGEPDREDRADEICQAVQEVLSRFAGDDPDPSLVVDITAGAMCALVVFAWVNGGAPHGADAAAGMFGAACLTYFQQLQEQGAAACARLH